MRIRKLTATFGCLDGAVLEIQPGLNELVLPNESGKSTWCAFLLAMFYGIDTTRRAAKGRLPDKERYQPWSGRPMSGTVELEQDGRVLVIQRTSERGKPLGTFRAYDQETGLELPSLTADNCGQLLLGVERGVFERTAFLRGSELAVTQEQDLARRLSGLAAAGAAEDSYPEAEKQLRLWQNRCRYHKTGRIPETQERLRQVRQKLEAVESVRRQRLETVLELSQVNRALACAREEEARQEQAQREQLRRETEQAHILYEQKLAQTAAAPDEERLRQMLAELEQEQAQVPEEPSCPEALRSLDSADLWPKVERDLRRYELLTAMTVRGSGGLLLAAAAGTALGIGLLVLRQWWLGAAAFLLSGVGGWNWIRLRSRNKEVNQHLEEAQALLESYDAETKEDMLTAAVLRRDWLLTRERAQQAAWQRELLLEEVRAFAPEAETPEEAGRAIAQALEALRELRQAEQSLERAGLQRQLAGGRREMPQVQQLHHRQIQLEAQAEGLLRQEQALGSWDEQYKEQETLEQRLEQLLRQERAIVLAREALASANTRMAQGYGPQLTGLAGDALKKLTGGRYDTLLLREDLELSVRETQAGLVRPLACLSRGTQDQIWLALRLAMTRLLLPPEAPIVLDDALLTFDDRREQAAMELLREEKRQVLLFSCR